jgi:hypothetical protein
VPSSSAARHVYKRAIMQYPSESELENCLKSIATEVGDPSRAPFRINVVPLLGKPPMYSVVILSASKEPLRERLGHLLSRSFSLGVSSFMLNGNEAASLITHQQRR